MKLLRIKVYKTINKVNKTYSALKLIYRIELDSLLSEMVEALIASKINEKDNHFLRYEGVYFTRSNTLIGQTMLPNN